MKAWGWISTIRSLEDVVKNAFEETTMKNVPIDQFWSFKWRNGVQNWNLREKLSKIGPVGNFDFWSKVNAKVNVNCPRSKSTVSANGSDPCSPGRVGPGQRSARWRGADEATLLTWLADVSRANVEWWRHQVTSDDVSSSVSARGRHVLSPPVCEGDARNLGGAWRRVRRRMTTRFSGQVDRWTARPPGWHMDQEDDLEVTNLRRHVVDFPELTAARGGAWLAFGWPDF